MPTCQAAARRNVDAFWAQETFAQLLPIPAALDTNVAVHFRNLPRTFANYLAKFISDILRIHIPSVVYFLSDLIEQTSQQVAG